YVIRLRGQEQVRYTLSQKLSRRRTKLLKCRGAVLAIEPYLYVTNFETRNHFAVFPSVYSNSHIRVTPLSCLNHTRHSCFYWHQSGRKFFGRFRRDAVKHLD